MKNFLIFLALVFSGLFAALFVRQSQDPNRDLRPTLRVFAPTSFIKQWGPGPWLKEKFESGCDCKVEFHDASDSTSLIQRVKLEPKNKAADLVLGFDQYDLEQAQIGIDWKPIKIDINKFDEAIRPLLGRASFVPYDWGVFAFLAHKSQVANLPKNLDDLLAPELLANLSVQDPRTSTPGMQLLLWLIQAKGEEEAFKFLQKFSPQVKIWGPNWSMAYGMFQKEQVKMTFSYVTSPLASMKEDPKTDVVALEFSEGHPVQYEFLGIPATCQNCDLAEKFINLILSPEGQRVIMEKNFMFPVAKSAMRGTLFESIPEYKTIDMTVIPNIAERERILKKWSQLHRSD